MGDDKKNFMNMFNVQKTSAEKLLLKRKKLY